MGATVESVEHRFGAPEIKGVSVLTLQRDPYIFERGQMREYRRNLKRAHQPETRDVGRRQRGDIPPFIQNLAGRRLQELGQQVEPRGFSGPVWPNQRMNAPTSDPKADIENSEEACELLRQSLRFENELIGQSNFPRQPSPRRTLARGQFF